MEKKKETMLGFQEQLKVEVDSPPLSPRSSDDDDETEPDDSDAEEEEGGDGVGTGAAVVSGPPLKKGPWTPDEDKRLRTYVEAHGEGNWNNVQRNAGLNRCGKSCRLRWANHLRPHLKKGPFSEEEEQKIIEFHAMYGNKWAKMAHDLPGRTDNEIKNFWNTRKKRREKSGLGLYPDGLLSRVQNQDRNSDSLDDSRGKKRPNELSQGNGLVFDDIVFEKLDYKKRAENFLAPPFMIQASLPMEAINPLKRHASSDMVSGYSVSPTCEGFAHEHEKTCYIDVYPEINQNVPFNNAIANGLPIVNGNFSTSGTIQRPMKMELPSFQNTGYEPVDSFISSPASVLVKPNYFSCQNNGLLDAIVQHGNVSGDLTKFEGANEVSVYTNPFSPHSSVFDENLLEGAPSDEFRTSPGSLDDIFPNMKDQSDNIYPDSYLSPCLDTCMRDASPEPRYLNEESPHSEYQHINQAFKVILYGDSCDEGMLSTAGDGHPLGLESVHWNSMPGAHHLSELSPSVVKKGRS